MPSNQAAWLTAKSATPVVVKSAPYTKPGADEIVVKNLALAINPVDWIKQVGGNMLFSWLGYPLILGSDVAGEVVEVGPGVNRFRAGDRVLGHAVGMDKRSNKTSEGGFQQYTVLRTNLASPIPSSMSYESACVLPLCLSTAACGLFMKDFLALQYPTSSKTRTPTGQTLLVWGGSTGVGSNAIQLAVAAGYDVITTCSPRNFAYVRQLGACEVFDYSSKSVVADLVHAFQDRVAAGALAVGNNSTEGCVAVLAAATTKASGGRNFVAQATPTMPAAMDEVLGSARGFVAALPAIVWTNVSLMARRRVGCVRTKFISGSDLMANEVGRVVYEDFLPDALARGEYVAAPEPLVVGRGLEFVQEAMDLNRKGVSAKKVVVAL